MDCRVYGDDDVRPLAAAALGPDFADLWDRIALPTAKSDLARLILLWAYGGVYLDIHVGSTNAEGAAALAAMGIPAFACTPDAFPDLMALALNRGDVSGWAASERVEIACGGGVGTTQKFFFLASRAQVTRPPQSQSVPITAAHISSQ